MWKTYQFEADSTLTTQPKLLDNRSTSTSDDFNLLEGLTTGHFDAKNKLLLRTVSNPELHTIEEVPEDTMTHSFKLTRSLSDLYDIHPPILAILTSTQFRNENFEETVTNLKHSSSEPDLHVNDIQDNDDDDVWCNQEDEDNLEHRVKIDQERIEQLRQILGHETLQILLDVCQENEPDIQILKNLIPKDKHYLLDSELLLILTTIKRNHLQ